MGRDIWFRAWDKTNKRMLHNAQNTYDNLSPCDTEDWEIASFGDLLESERWEVMQYTGLSDRNGKPIYEGDWLRHENGWLAFIGFGSGCFYWHALESRMNTKDWQEATWRNFEVIGNVYEHSHLLENSFPKENKEDSK